MPNSFPVKNEIKTYVDKLLKKHFGDEWRKINDLGYYKNVLDREDADHQVLEEVVINSHIEDEEDWRI